MYRGGKGSVPGGVEPAPYHTISGRPVGRGLDPSAGLWQTAFAGHLRGVGDAAPFMFAGEMDGKLWFCTNSTKDVYKDMQQNPEIEISVSSPEYAWIRLHGKAVFENNMAAKEMCIANPIVKGQYGEATNPIFEVFYLENAHGLIADFSGNPPYEF